jgi:anti-sigma factor RsiW
MTAEHPSPTELLDLHFDELRGPRRNRIAMHVSDCPRCRETVESLEWVQRSLATLPEEAPPEDGLARVMESIAHSRPSVRTRAGWTAPVAASFGGVGAGVGVIYAAGARLLTLPMVAELPLLEPLKVLSSFGLAALVFFSIGSFVTLALAPVLMMESQSHTRALATR